MVASLQHGNSITPQGELAWPDGHRFALFLSHDIDQIHDREMWRFLGDLNYMRP